MAPRHYPLVPPVQRPPNLGDLTDEELGQLRAELEYLEKLAFLPRSRSEVGRIGRDEFPVPSGPRPLDRFEQAEREGRIPTEPIRGPEPTRKPKPTRKPEPQREESIFTRIVERVGETPIPSPIPTELFPGRTGPITFGEAGQRVGEAVGEAAGEAGQRVGEAAEVILPIIGETTIPSYPSRTFGEVGQRVVGELDVLQRYVEEPTAGIAASLGATAFIDPEIAESFLFASPERKEELLQAQGILQEHAVQARQEVERKVREKNPETLIEYVRAIWTSGGEYERERPEAFVGEKGIVQILFSPLNLIGIGLEPKVARLVALLFRKLRAKATRTGRGFQEVMEDVPADDISKAPLEDVSKAPLEEVLEEVLEQAAEAPLVREGLERVAEVVPEAREGLRAGRGGMRIADIDAELDRLAAQWDSLPVDASVTEYTAIARNMDRFTDIKEDLPLTSITPEARFAEESEITAGVLEALAYAAQEQPFARWTWLVSQTPARTVRQRTARGVREVKKPASREFGQIPESVSLATYKKITNKRASRANIIRGPGGIPRVPTSTAVNEPAAEAGMSTDDFIAEVERVWRAQEELKKKRRAVLAMRVGAQIPPSLVQKGLPLEEAAEAPTPRLRPAPAEEVEQVGFGQAGMGFGERPPQAGMGFGRRPPPDWVRQTEEARRLRALGREGLPLEEAAEAPTRVGAQTPEGNVVGASPLVEELPHREYWARPLSNQKMISGAFRDNFWRSLAQRTQGLKQFTALIDPAALVRGDSIEPVEIVKRGLLLRNRVLDVGDSATEIGMAWLREKQLPFEIGTDMRAAGVPNSPVWYDIFDNPSRFILTPKQKEYISLYQDLVDDALRLAKDNGIEVTEIQFAGGRHYIPRLVEAIRGLENTKAKGSKAWASAKEIGAKQSFQKTRFYEWAEDGVEKGVVYSADPISVMQHHIHSVYRAIADKRLADEVRPLGETVVEGVERKSPGLLAALEIAKKDFAKARQLLSAVNRAYRGERLPPSLVNSIRRSFPAEAAMLKAAGPNSPDLYQIETRARKLMAESRITWNNISGRVGRLKEAVRSPLDKGWVSQPFAGGRMFPKEVSEVLNKATGDQGQQWLKKYEDLNALSRTIGTTIDFGAPFIQGLAVLGENPRAWARATLMHYQAFLFPQVKQRYLVQNAEVIKEMAQYGITLGHTEFLAGNLPATGLMKLLPQETQTVLTWMGRKNPFHFQEAFGTFLDAAAIESWKALRSTAGREGNDSLFALADYVNHVRGTMSQRAIGIGATQQQIESSFMAFAIRYTKAGFALLTDMVKGNLKGNAVRANLTSTIGAATLFFLAGATAMSALGLISKEEIIRRMQPILNGRYNSRFFTLPFGTDDVGLGGFGYSLLRLLAGTTDKAIYEPEDLLKLDAKDNPLVSFIQSRLFGAAPMTSLAIELTTGTNWWGEKLTTIPDYSSAVARRFLPFWAESYLLQDPKADVKSFIPAVHGTRVFPQSYRARANKLEESLAAIKRKQETRSGTFGVVVAEESKRWDLPLNREERRILEAESPELAELKQKANEQSAGYRKNLVQEETESFYSGIKLGKLRRERELEQAYLSFAQAKIGGKAFRETRATQNTKFAGAIESLKEQYPLALTDRAARERYYQENRIAIKEAAVEDIVAEGYYSIEPRRDANGLEDMSQFFRDRKEYLERFDTETQDYVLHTYPNKRFTKEWMNKIEAIYQKDIETLRPYWEIRDQVEAEKPNASENLKNFTISARRVRMRRRDKGNNPVQQAGKRWEYFGDVPRRDTRTRGEAGLYPVTGVQGVTVIN